jgi:hypothetical protein
MRHQGSGISTSKSPAAKLGKCRIHEKT